MLGIPVPLLTANTTVSGRQSPDEAYSDGRALGVKAENLAVRALESTAVLLIMGKLKDKTDGRNWIAKFSTGKVPLTESDKRRCLSIICLLCGSDRERR